MELSFCRRCGTQLSAINGNAYRCANGHTIYANPVPTASAFVITPGGNVLLGRRGLEPCKGSLDSIGGFIDLGETLEQAVVREMQEEAGLVPGEYGDFHYITSTLFHYEFKGEPIPVVAATYWTKLLTDRELQASDDLVEFVECPIDASTLELIAADDVRDAFAALINLKSEILQS